MSRPMSVSWGQLEPKCQYESEQRQEKRDEAKRDGNGIYIELCTWRCGEIPVPVVEFEFVADGSRYLTASHLGLDSR
jgi:hypothetical protein